MQDRTISAAINAMNHIIAVLQKKHNSLTYIHWFGYKSVNNRSKKNENLWKSYVKNSLFCLIALGKY